MDGNHDRLALWLPVLFGTGIAVYFSLTFEPAFWLGGVSLVVFASVSVFLIFRRGFVFYLGVVGTLVSAGFSAAQLHAHLSDAPKIARKIGPVEISGRVLHVEPTENGVRVLLDTLVIPRLTPAGTPDRVRISVRGTDHGMAPGRQVRLLVILQPPPEPALPGGYDFARKAWFERIGAVGFSLGPPRSVSHAAGFSLRASVASLRQHATERILAAAPAGTGPVAAALMTGERRAIPEATLAAMRDSGLAHLLAISGLHIGLVAGLLFFAVRFVLSAVEPLALRCSTKKIAAVFAIAGAFGYLLISGGTIPTQRAFLMVAITLLAVLIDRNAISMRLVAVAATAVLLLAPESLLSASFQMSFAAVVALIAVYERVGGRLAARRRRNGLLVTIGLFFAATLLTTIIATVATSPFAAFHFNRLALYGLPANMLAVPLTALWIMPWSIAAFGLMPFGLESLALTPMGWGIEAVLAVAGSISALPGAVALIPPMPVLALGFIALGGLWACIWRGPWRWAAVPVVAAGLASPSFTTQPDMLVDAEGGQFAVRLAEGKVFLFPTAGKQFQQDMWLRHLTATEPVGTAGTPEPLTGAACDGRACIFELKNRTVSVIFDTAALAEDCGRVDHIILLARAPRRACVDDTVLISTFHLWRDGAHAVTFSESGARVRTAREIRGDRPWSRLSPQKRQYLRTSPTRQP